MFDIIILPKARDDLKKSDKKTVQRMIKKIEWLSRHSENITHIPLKGIFEGIYKLRVGAWRILYGIDYGKKTIFIYRIGHRKEIYK